ncbi:hypothetical protein J1605_003050 [Eschrichtius robustus]|uniref:Uncharacterized protein n=1 Tax=Eschrichtius robustus TaxID=9764 RepID=A0AB34HPL3_ESCRO|nr:hypothetical protein J1605_003050 [Eschrichtius robustus]
MDLEAGRIGTVRVPRKTEDEFERGSSSSSSKQDKEKTKKEP